MEIIREIKIIIEFEKIIAMEIIVSQHGAGTNKFIKGTRIVKNSHQKNKNGLSPDMMDDQSFMLPFTGFREYLTLKPFRRG